MLHTFILALGGGGGRSIRSSQLASATSHAVSNIKEETTVKWDFICVDFQQSKFYLALSILTFNAGRCAGVYDNVRTLRRSQGLREILI